MTTIKVRCPETDSVTGW